MPTQHTHDGSFYGTQQLGSKQMLTPEGFLICYDVPIARIGTMDYAAVELPELEDKDGVIQVERSADLIFSPETMASYEGKPVTLDHPFEPVSPANWSAYAKGNAKNVRRGEGEQSDLLLADLLITDKVAIAKVRSKELTEVSCGYDSKYEQISPGRAAQKTNVGNHIALVRNARCGTVCSIGDSRMPAPTNKKPAKLNFADRLRKAFMTRDSDDFEKTMSEVTDSDEDGTGNGSTVVHVHLPADVAKPAAAATTTDDDPPADGANAEVLAAIKGVADVVTGLVERVTALESANQTPAGDDDGDDDMTDDDGDEVEKVAKTTATGDSAKFRDEFQDAKARAEILAPGVNLPTFDARAAQKKTTDSICVLRRRALRAGLTTDSAAMITAVLGGQDISKMPCDAIKPVFNAASELVKQRNKMTTATPTNDSKTAPKDLNQIHKEFWARNN